MFYDYVIIGGGASGMCTAINLKKNNNSVLIIEHNDRLGKKILSTGNGRCNLTNELCKVDLFESNPEGIYPYYTTGRKEFIEIILKKFDSDDSINWFKSLGMVCVNKNGYYYPMNEQASSVLDLLRLRVSILDIDTQTSYKVNSINKTGDSFVINNVIKCNNLVLCCGGAASPKTGSDGSGYNIAKSFGHTIIKPIPSLCGIKLKGDSFKIMQGVRADARLKLFNSDSKEQIIMTNGNVQFNSYGISGIPAMNISGIIGRKLNDKEKLSINIEFLPDFSFEYIVEFITGTFNSINKKSRDTIPIDFCLNGLLNKKISMAFLKELGISSDYSINKAITKFINSREYNNGLNCAKHLGNLNTEKIFAARIAGIIKHFSAEVLGINSFDEAQVTSGGVSTSEINPENMESLLIPGLFFAGEIIDVDGICGGYNLQWAWSSAMNVGEKNG